MLAAAKKTNKMMCDFMPYMSGHVAYTAYFWIVKKRWIFLSYAGVITAEFYFK